MTLQMLAGFAALAIVVLVLSVLFWRTEPVTVRGGTWLACLFVFGVSAVCAVLVGVVFLVHFAATGTWSFE